MPTLLVFGAMTPVVAAAGATAPVGLLDLAAAALALGALAVETLADEQLRAYRHSEPEPDAFLATGLWAWSRHPNYLGEVGFWWGVALFGVAVGAPVTLLGALCITLLFWFISIPLIDARMCARRPAYQAHQARVPRLFPLLPW